MKLLSSEEIKNSLPFIELINGLKNFFVEDITVPLRHHHTIPSQGDGLDATLLLMPAWANKDIGGVKIVNVNPDNRLKGIPALSASYLLFDRVDGNHLAVLDGGEITARRTVAASALAADFLAKPDASTLLIVGTGRIAYNLPYAYQVVRPIKRVILWGRDLSKAELLKSKLEKDGFNVVVKNDLEQAVNLADIISCATLSNEPLIKGNWLKPGQYLDLIGGFTPTMREADDQAIARSSVFIDTSAALNESGDILTPIRNGLLTRADIKADLYDLCRNKHFGRQFEDEIILFKAVGTALEDLAAAVLAYKKHSYSSEGNTFLHTL